MTVSINYRKLLHRKTAEPVSFCPITPSNGTGIKSVYASAVFPKNIVYMFTLGNSVLEYNMDDDSWINIPFPSGLGGTFGAGSCCEFKLTACPGSQNISVFSGTTTTMLLALGLTSSLAGHRVRIVSGTNAGYEGTIVSNDVNTVNCNITVSPAAPVAFDTTSVLMMFTGSFWVFNAGTTSTTSMAVYDRATASWGTRNGNPTATWGTDGQLIATCSVKGNGGAGFDAGTSTGTNTATTLNDTSKSAISWGTTNMWANYQVRITGGTGKGQIRTIVSSTATTLNISPASSWTVIPDATSTYRIEGNDDYLYLIGNNSPITYKYQISTNVWSTVAARLGASAAVGATADWAHDVAGWTAATSTTAVVPGFISAQNGRYIYSFRAGTSNFLDVYDIALDTWATSVIYGGAGEVFSGGTTSVGVDGMIYLQRDFSGRILKFDIAKCEMIPFTTSPVTQGGSYTVGSKMFIGKLIEGSSTVVYLYTLAHAKQDVVRYLLK